jgi:hypothetical protein
MGLAMDRRTRAHYGEAEMKLVVDKFMYEAPGLSIIPETEFEAAVLQRYWGTARLSKGRATSESRSVNGFSYSIKFVEPKQPGAPESTEDK